MRLGRVWLVRVGIVILLTGLVFLGNYAYHEFVGLVGPIGKLALLYIAGGALAVIGSRLARKQTSLLHYGRVLVAGGCAIIYYATFAAHFIPTLRVIGSPFVGGALLLALGGAFIAWANRLRSQTLAAATIALTFYTAAINPVATFSLFSNLVISVVAIVLLARQRWVSTSLLSLLGTYGSFAFWRFQQTHTLAISPVDASLFWPAVLFPAAYWIVHTFAVLMKRINALDPSLRPVFLTLNNAAFFALAGPVIAGTHPDSFWLAAVVFGAILLALSIVAARTSPEEKYLDSSYLTQGLALVFLGLLVYRFTNAQLAISFALLSGTLISFSHLRHGGIFRFFAAVAAVVATYVAFDSVVHGDGHARGVAISVAAILAGTAWLLKRYQGLKPECNWRVLGFTFLAGLLVVPAFLQGDQLQLSALEIAGIALVAMLTLRLHRLPEAAYIAQPLALCGQLLLLAEGIVNSMRGSTVAISAALGLTIIHLWQSRSLLPLAGRKTWQTLHCLTPVILSLLWVYQSLDPIQRGPVLAILALIILTHSLVTRTWVFAGACIPFTMAAIFETASAIHLRVALPGPAITTALLLAQSAVIEVLGRRVAFVTDIRLSAAQALRAAAAAIVVGMVFAYLPSTIWFLVLTTAAFGSFALTCARPRSETALYVVVLTAIAGFAWIEQLFVAPPQAIDLLGFGLFAAAQQIGKRRLAGSTLFNAQLQALLCTVVVVGTWVVLHRLMAPMMGGFFITVLWSLLALAILGAGFALRERAYRLLGLTILAAAVCRIVLFDIWQLETLFRILSFMVLGSVLLLLGFIYNRHAETLRKWL